MTKKEKMLILQKALQDNKKVFIKTKNFIYYDYIVSINKNYFYIKNSISKSLILFENIIEIK